MRDPSSLAAVVGAGAGDALALATAIASGLLAARWLAGIASEDLVFEPQNWAVRLPRSRFGRPWRFVRDHDGEDHDVSLKRGEVHVHFRSGVVRHDWFPTAATLANRYGRSIAARGTQYRELSRENVVVGERGEITGVVLGTEVDEPQQGKILREIFAHARHGFHHAIVAVFPASSRTTPKARRALLMEFVRGMRVLDEGRRSYDVLPRLEAPVVGAASGELRFVPDDAGWHEAADASPQLARREFGVVHRDGAAVLAQTLPLPAGSKPSALRMAELAIEAWIGKQGLRSLGERQDGDADEAEFAARASHEHGEYRFRYLMRVEPRRAALVIAMVGAETPDGDALLARALRCIQWSEPQPAITPADVAARLEERWLPWAVDLWAKLGQEAERYRDLEGMRVAFELVCAARPTDGNAHMWPLAALVKQERFEEALERLRALRGRFTDNLDLWAYEPALLMKLGRVDEARPLYASLFERGLADRFRAGEYAQALCEKGFEPTAAAFLCEFGTKQADDESLAWGARLRARSGDADGALANLEAARRARPESIDLIAAWLELLGGEGRGEAMQRAFQELPPRLQRERAVRRARGVAEARLEWWAAAKATFEDLVTEQPTDGDAGAWLRHVVNSSGGADVSLVRTPIPPVPYDASLLPQGRAIPYRTDVVCLLHVRAVAIEPDGSRFTIHQVLRPCTAAGVQELAEQVLAFDAEVERLHLEALLVRDASGAVRAQARIEDAYVKDAQDPNGIDAKKTLHVPVPGVRMGDTLELTATWRRRRAEGGIDFSAVSLHGHWPTERAALFVSGGGERVLVRKSDRVTERPMPAGERLFVAEGVDVPLGESLMADARHDRPWVDLCCPQRSWREVGEAALSDLRHRLDQGVEVLAPALHEALEGCGPSEEERAFAIAHWVARTLRYRCVAFGPGRVAPPPVADVLRDRAGDCKAHALLVRELSCAAGIACHLALVHSRLPVWEEAPEASQFDHMIAYWPNVRDGVFVDTTVKGLDLAVCPTNGWVERSALVLEPGNCRLERVRPAPADTHRLSVERVVTLHGSGDAESRVDVSATGHPAQQLRQWLASDPSSTRLASFEQWLRNRDPRVRAHDLEVVHADDARMPLHVQWTERIPAALFPVAHYLTGVVGAAFEANFRQPTRVEPRRSSFGPMTPLETRTRMRLRLPEGFAPSAEMASSRRGGEAPGVTWQASIELRNAEEGARDAAAGACDEVWIEAIVSTQGGPYPPAAWTEHCEALEAAAAALAPRLVLEQKR